MEKPFLVLHAVVGAHFPYLVYGIALLIDLYILIHQLPHSGLYFGNTAVVKLSASLDGDIIAVSHGEFHLDLIKLLPSQYVIHGLKEYHAGTPLVGLVAAVVRQSLKTLYLRIFLYGMEELFKLIIPYRKYYGILIVLLEILCNIKKGGSLRIFVFISLILYLNFFHILRLSLLVTHPQDASPTSLQRVPLFPR